MQNWSQREHSVGLKNLYIALVGHSLYRRLSCKLLAKLLWNWRVQHQLELQLAWWVKVVSSGLRLNFSGFTAACWLVCNSYANWWSPMQSGSDKSNHKKTFGTASYTSLQPISSTNAINIHQPLTNWGVWVSRVSRAVWLMPNWKIKCSPAVAKLSACLV